MLYIMEKISLEQFRNQKEQLIQLIESFQNSHEEHKNDENYDLSKLVQKFLDEYIEMLNILLQYDLSAIPFEEWKNIMVLSDETHPLDFSKTRANIDFKMVTGCSGYENFKGCNIRNLEMIGPLNPNNFDEKTIESNKSLFLSDNFSEEFKKKYYSGLIDISDIATLTAQEFDEIKTKNLKSRMNYSNYFMISKIGIDKAVQLYQRSSEEYEAVDKLINMNQYSYSESNNLPTFDEFIQQLEKVDASKIKEECFNYARKRITNSNLWISDINLYPEQFVNENSDILLIGASIPDDVKKRYFQRSLYIQDLIDYPEVFSSIPVDYFMDNSISIVKTIRNNYGIGEFQKLVYKHPDLCLHIENSHDFYSFNNLLVTGENLESSFARAVKEYLLINSKPEELIVTTEDGQKVYNVPDWLSSMNFQVVEELKTNDELLQYNDSTLVLDMVQASILFTFGIDNIKKFEQETGFFTHKAYDWSKDLEMFRALMKFFKLKTLSDLKNEGIDFKYGSLPYEEFLEQFARCLDFMKKNQIFVEYPNYDWIHGEFREKHPEIFIDLSAPDELREAFYKNTINPQLLFGHDDYIKYLVDKDLSSIIKADMKLKIPGMVDDQGRMLLSSSDFLKEYVSRYGNEKFLKLCTKYGIIITNIDIISLNNEIEDEQAIEQLLRRTIYNKIISNALNYAYLANVPEMIAEYPEIFVDFDSLTDIPQDVRESIAQGFYSRSLRFDTIKKYPSLTKVLKDKNLSLAFSNRNVSGSSINYSEDLELLSVFGNEKFLQLCTEYGRYMDGIAQHLKKEVTIKDGGYFDLSHQGNDNGKSLTFEDISKRIESIIVRESKLGNIAYQPDDAPSVLVEKSPELFLSDDAPDELKQFFYNQGNNYPMTFSVLQQHDEWYPYLADKSVMTSLLRNNALKKDLIKYYEAFGEEKGIKLGISRAETVDRMIESHQVDLMKSWYDRTGGKFIPDVVVMQNFSLEEADKFLTSGSNWSSLMRIQNFSRESESRDAMLKLAYSFGAFDQDQRGFKKLLDLLTDLPRNISSNYSHIMKNICSLEEQGKTLSSINFGTPKGYEEYLQLKEMLVKEGFQLNPEQELFSQIYIKEADGSYSLSINPQNYPKSSQLIRSILEVYPNLPVLTPDKAHQLFGGFELKYDPDFREFLLANMIEILENAEYIRYVASMQRQFSDIKAANSNRTLTLELAISFLQTNKYTSVNVGNERAAEISAIAGYSQSDFNILQQIYNYGKQRTFSSIPRIEHSIEKKTGRYTYEILRLDDPLAMAIGTLTDCCQELHDHAEVCMEHSMVDKNGRVFVIKDENGNIIAQSWVWRNKDVLCFDNIEIPAKAFTRVVGGHSESGRMEFTDEIFEIYKQAAHDLIEADEKVYKELLENGKITQEQYDGLRLGKVTVGLGYNDIAISLKKNSKLDSGIISRPLPFDEPVKLSRGLYSSDSKTQYILEEREDRKEFDGDTLPVHSDTYIEYTDANFEEKSLLALEKLEIVTKGNTKKINTSIGDYADLEHLVTEIARNYSLNPETTRIIMNPNFAIIYDVNGNKLKIGDLLFNTRVDNEQQQMDIENQVVMQMRLALEQIASDKNIDVSSLNEEQLKMYAKITGLTDEMDIERGVGHAR